MVKVSLVVAVYNMEEYLEKCLDSLLGQTLREIEVIAVNDGSTDSSAEILARYAQNDSRLLVLHKENGGISDARNHGLPHAKGEFITFLDSDDFFDEDMCEVMYEKAVEEGLDIVECNLHHTFRDYEDTELMTRYYHKRELICHIRHVVWNKLYRRDWLMETGVIFPKGLIYEDVVFTTKLIPYIRAYGYVGIAPVHYVQRLSSTNNFTSTKTMDILAGLENVLRFYQNRGFYEEYKHELEYFFTRTLLCSSFARMCRMNDHAQRKFALRANWRMLTNNFPHWRKNAELKRDKTRQGLFMKTVTATSYKIYCVVLPWAYLAKRRLSRKWNNYTQ